MSSTTIFTFPESSIGKIATKKMISVMPMIICALLAAFIIANHLETMNL